MCIKQILLIVPRNQRALFAVSFLFIKALAITTTLFSLVSYVGLFSFLSSYNKIYLWGISCSALSFFLLLLLGGPSQPMAVCFVFAGETLQFLLCAFLSELWKQSLSGSVQSETGSENFQPNYSKLITFMVSTFRDTYQESKRQPLWLPLMIPTPPIPLLLSLSTENSIKTDFGLKAKETPLKNMAYFNVWKCYAKARGGCWRDVISAQCSECQSEEIQWSAGIRQE